MLVLSRKKEETIFVGDNITIKVVEIVGNRVILGIKAPKSVVVDRKEIHERRKLEKDSHQNECPETD